MIKQHNLPEQLRILANDLPMHEFPLISDRFEQAYQVDPLLDKKLRAIKEKVRLKEITIAQCT